MKKTLPKKAKLISAGGFYRIVPMNEFTQKFNLPITRRIRINQPDLDWKELFHFNLEFVFERIYKGYLEYRQVNEIKIENT